jgi:methylmalonyl-CoA/ethylmalonyl-CoA epimerase
MIAGATDHVAIAVRSLSDAARLFVDVMGATFIAGGDDLKLGIRTAQVLFPPGVKIELMQPLSDDSYLARFIEKHGEGFHHMTTFFDDITELISELDANGFTTVDTSFEDPTWSETFVRPRAAFGALLQMVQTDRDWTVRHDHITLEDVLSGRVVWAGSETHLVDDEDGNA